MSKSTSFIKKRINPILLIILFLLFVSVKSQVTKICEKTSSEFARYYRLGDTNILGMDEENTKKYDSEHIKALINIVDYYYGNKKVDNFPKCDERIAQEAFNYFMKVNSELNLSIISTQFYGISMKATRCLNCNYIFYNFSYTLLEIA